MSRERSPRAARISLALAIHNHQPVGNFGWVFAEVYEQAYLPMVDALERHPSVRSRCTTRDRCSNGSGASDRSSSSACATLVARGQVEMLGGAYYEPVLASLPERDRLGQLRRMADEIESLSGTRPRGAWLAERVWEPSLPTHARRRRLSLDDRRRQPLPGGGDPQRGALGRVHDRGPGAPAHASSARSRGCATSSRSGTSTTSSAICATTRRTTGSASA